jgi:hypothetical protein
LPEDTLLQKAGNGLMFNISWLVIVSSQSAPVALAVVFAHLALHQLWIGKGWRELSFIAGVTLFGLLLDQVLFAAGLFNVAGEWSLAPLWLSCLWPVLATTLHHAFAGLQRHLTLAAVLGAAGGAGSYYAGTAMTAVDFTVPLYGLVVIGATWAVLFPALALAARTWFTEEPRREASLA